MAHNNSRNNSHISSENNKELEKSSNEKKNSDKKVNMLDDLIKTADSKNDHQRINK